MCEVCGSTNNVRDVHIEKESREEIILKACPEHALMLVGYERD